MGFCSIYHSEIHKYILRINFLFFLVSNSTFIFFSSRPIYIVNIHDTFYIFRKHLCTAAFGLWTDPSPACQQYNSDSAVLQPLGTRLTTSTSMARCLQRLESALQAEAPPCSVPICAASIYASICVGFLFCVTLLILAWLLYALC